MSTRAAGLVAILAGLALVLLLSVSVGARPIARRGGVEPGLAARRLG